MKKILTTGDTVTIPVQHYKDLIAEHFFHMATLNALNEAKVKMDAVKEKEKIVELWKNFYPDIKTFEDLVEEFFKASVVIYSDDIKLDMEDERDEYELYCK
jgi:hypothetical protein